MVILLVGTAIAGCGAIVGGLCLLGLIALNNHSDRNEP